MIPIFQHEPGEPITKPALYAVDEADYHADNLALKPSLSSTLARVIVEQSPLHAWFAHPRLNPDMVRTSSKTMNFGSCHHALLLGTGRDIEILDYEDFKTKAAQEDRDASIEDGRTPVLRKHYDHAKALVALARRQIAAFELLSDLMGDDTIFEHAAVWREGEVWCRALMDIVRVYPDFIAIVDFKSTEGSAAPTALERQIFGMGYDVQLAFYRRGLRRVIGRNCPPIRCFIAEQERTGPGALSIVELDEDVLTLADKKVVAALRLWKISLQRNEWPGYPPIVPRIDLLNRQYIERDWLARESNDDVLAGAGYEFALPIDHDTGQPLFPEALRAG